MNETPTPTAADFADALRKAEADILAGLGKIGATFGTVAQAGPQGVTLHTVRGAPEPERVSLSSVYASGDRLRPGGGARPVGLSLAGVAAPGMAGPLAFTRSLADAQEERLTLASLGYDRPGDKAALMLMAQATGRPLLEVARRVSPDALRRFTADPGRHRAEALGRLASGATQSRAVADLEEIAALVSAIRDPYGDRRPQAPQRKGGKWGGPTHPAAKRKGGKRRR